MANELKIEHAGKTYVLKSKMINGELIDAVTPVRAVMVQHAQAPALMQAALSDDKIFEFVDPISGAIRDNITTEQLVEFARSNRQLMQALQTPTVNLATHAQGRKVMAELIQITVDRSLFSKELIEAIDSQHFTKIVAKPLPEVVDGDATERVQEYDTTPTSDFWKTFPVDVMIEYTETFCKRARI